MDLVLGEESSGIDTSHEEKMAGAYILEQIYPS